MTRHYPDLGSASDGLKKIPKQAARSLAAVTTFTYKNREKTPNFMKKNLKNLEGSYIGKWFPIFTGHPMEHFEKKALKEQQSMNKSFWNHFRHLGDCLKKFICSSFPARLMEEFPASKVHLQPATWLTGEFLSRRMSRHYWPVGVWS